MNVTELHLHTDKSLLDGLNNPEEYFARAKEIGMSHMAITDHGVLSNHREFQRQAKAAGITPILGCEMYISELGRLDRTPPKKRDETTEAYNHIIVLAKNAKGLDNLNTLSEKAWTEGFYTKPRIDIDLMEEYHEGLIVLSGCYGGLISKALLNGKTVQADTYARQFQDIFGDDFYMEIQGHNPAELNHGLLDLAKKHGIKPVVTSDCHYARKEDLWLEEAMLILSTSPKQAKNFDFDKSRKMDMLDRFNYLWPDRRMTFQEYQIYLRSATEHLELLAAQGIDDAPIRNTMEVAAKIEEYPYHENLDLLPVPASGDSKIILRDMVEKGAKERGTWGVPEYDARREEELSVIFEKDFDPYFIVEAETVQWGKEQGIMFGPGRGSGAGSLVNYELGVTEVDPIPNGLLFFRFINPERNDFPDIDTDVEDKRRYEIKEYLRRKYKHVASIATFGTFAGKNSVRDAARVFAVPLGEVNRALKGADWPPQMDFFKMFLDTEKGKEFAQKYPEVMKVAKFLHGRTRTQGMHAGGIVVSKEPIEKYAPMQSAVDNSDPAANRIPLIAVDMDEAASIGFIKYDFLGLKALSVISDTLKMIKDRKGIDVDLYNIGWDDKRVYTELSKGNTQGVFQAEGHTFTGWLKEAGASEFNDLVIGTSIARPGPLTTVGEAFKRRKFGQEEIEYAHPVMYEHTKETLGLIVYQEQVMQAMTDLAGMKMSTADKVRKIIGKKRDVKEFEQYKKEFVDGASEKVGREVAEKLWHDFEAHAGYSFNKSHAFAYSMVTYWTAWLKINYPIEFMTAVLRNEDDKDKSLEYLLETKRMGIRVMLPHVNASGESFEIQSNDQGEFIRIGLSNIKFVAEKAAHKLIAERPFANYEELHKFCMKKYSGLGARVTSSLNAIGAAAFEDNPRLGTERKNFYEYLNIPAFETRDLPDSIKRGLRPLDEFHEKEAFVCLGMVRKIKTGQGWARIDIVDETGTAGVFANEHHSIETGQLYVFLIANNRIARYITIADILAGEGGEFVDFLSVPELYDVPDGMYRVVSFNSKKTKKGDKMADAVLSDNQKNLLPALVWPSGFMKAYTAMKPGSVVDIKLGRTEDGTLFIDNVL